jgi:hypothetical protein
MNLRFRIHNALLLFCVIVMMRLQIRQLLQLPVVLNPFRQAPPLSVVELSIEAMGITLWLWIVTVCL